VLATSWRGTDAACERGGGSGRGIEWIGWGGGVRAVCDLQVVRRPIDRRGQRSNGRDDLCGPAVPIRPRPAVRPDPSHGARRCSLRGETLRFAANAVRHLPTLAGATYCNAHERSGRARLCVREPAGARGQSGVGAAAQRRRVGRSWSCNAATKVRESHSHAEERKSFSAATLSRIKCAPMNPPTRPMRMNAGSSNHRHRWWKVISYLHGLQDYTLGC
jgi:hypothetical protein